MTNFKKLVTTQEMQAALEFADTVILIFLGRLVMWSHAHTGSEYLRLVQPITFHFCHQEVCFKHKGTIDIHYF